MAGYPDNAKGMQILATGVWREPENKGKLLELDNYIRGKQAGEVKILSVEDEAKLEAGSVFGMLTKHFPSKIEGKAMITVGTGRGTCQWVLYDKGSKGEIAKMAFSKGYAKDVEDAGKADDKAAAFNDLWSAISDKSADGVVIVTWGASGAFVDWPDDPNQINENIVSAVVANGQGGLEWINSEAQGVNMLVLSSMTLPDGTNWKINWCTKVVQDYVDLGSGKVASVKGPGGEQTGKVQFDFENESIAHIGDKIISLNKDQAVPPAAKPAKPKIQFSDSSFAEAPPPAAKPKKLPKPGEKVKEVATEAQLEELQGILWKKSPGFLGFGSYQKRWVRVRNNRLCWWSDEAQHRFHATDSDAHPVGSLDLALNAFNVTEDGELRFAIEPADGQWNNSGGATNDFTGMENGRKFNFDASDSEIAASVWIEVIRKQSLRLTCKTAA